MINSNSELSVVVPLYNCEEFVEQAIRSCIGQIENMEIIVVNDGSTDSGPSVVHDISRQFPIVKLVDQENQGLSAARNAGAEVATGKYLYFLDSDDWIEKDCLGAILSTMKSRRHDLMLFHGTVRDIRAATKYDFYDWWVWEQLGNEGSLTPTSDQACLLYELEPQIALRVFRTKFFRQHNLRFLDGHQFEDFAVHVKAIELSTSTGFCRNKIFNYRLGRPGQITEQISERRLDVLSAYEDTLDFLLERKRTITIAKGAAYVRGIFRMLTWCATHTPDELVKTYNEQAMKLVAKTPKKWIDSALENDERSVLRLAYLGALYAGDIRSANVLARTGLSPVRNFPRVARFAGFKRAVSATFLRTFTS